MRSPYGGLQTIVPRRPPVRMVQASATKVFTTSETPARAALSAASCTISGSISDAYASKAVGRIAAFASAGIAGVALGFGAQNLVRDFISGMFMLLEDQYGVGDVVDVGDAIGTVESVGLRVTTIRDIDGTLWYCRNGEILRVGNMSQGHAVAVVDVPIAPTANVDRAQQVAFRAGIEPADRDDIAPYVLEKPELLGVNSVTAGAVTLRMTVRVRAGKQWAVRRALTGAVLESFDSNGIESPSLMLAPVAT